MCAVCTEVRTDTSKFANPTCEYIIFDKNNWVTIGFGGKVHRLSLKMEVERIKQCEMVLYMILQIL